MQLTRKQEEGYHTAIKNFHNKEPYTCIAGYAGTGKAQPIDTLIPTPEGVKKMGDIKEGDYIFDKDGKPTKVLKIFPQGEIDCYKITLKDGRESFCGEEHLWSYYITKNRLKQKTTLELMESGLKDSNSCYKFKIPVNKPVEYSKKDFSIHPYMIGAFLGDGCCKQRYLTISSENEEIPNIIGKLIDATPIKNSDKNYNWTFEWNTKTLKVEWTGGNGAQRETIRTKPKTEDYFLQYEDCLMVKADLKKIPEEYKYGSIEQRYELLQGLMDTDGSIGAKDGHRYNMRFTSISIQLIKDIQEILWGLGYSSTIIKDKRAKKYTSTGICYGLNINIPNEEKYKFFKLSRKKEIAEEAKNYHKRKDYTKVAITSIEKMPYKKEMVCFYVDNEEHLYLTNDYIVTHNTTLVNFIISALELDPEKEVCFCAATGKAAKVLQEKGNSNAKTAHKLLYDYAPIISTGGYSRVPRWPGDPKGPSGYKLVVVDEVSMLPDYMWDLLLSHNVPVIALGDPYQMPAVLAKDSGVLEHPHVFLDEVMRQAQDSEIIRMSMFIRSGRPLSEYKADNEQVQVFSQNELSSGMLTWADQILCAKNKTRLNLNLKVRELLGYSEEPATGDRVICLDNHWKFLDSKGESPLVNGSIGEIKVKDVKTVFYPYKACRRPVKIVLCSFTSDSGEVYPHMALDYQALLTGKKFLTPKEEFDLFNLGAKTRGNPVPMNFAFARAVTTHKAQGSEWKRVLVVEENFPFGKVEHSRWVYTAATRSSEKLVMIRK